MGPITMSALDERERRALRELLAAEAGRAEPAFDGLEDDEPEEEERQAPRRAGRRPARRASSLDTAVIDRETIRAFARRVLQFGAPVLFYLGLVGSVGAFTDVRPMVAHFPLVWIGAAPMNAIIGGLLVQAVISIAQYMLAPAKLTLRSLAERPWYSFWLALDTAITVYGYRLVAVPLIAAALRVAVPQVPEGGATAAAYLIAFIGAVVLAVLPERILVRG